jgi:hypothetical protein
MPQTLLHTIGLIALVSVVGLAQTLQRFEVLASFAKTAARAEHDTLVFLGPQEAFYITWVLGNAGSDPVVVPPADKLITVSMTASGGQVIPVVMSWEPTMRRSGPGTRLPFEDFVGQSALAKGESVSVYAVLQRADRRPFAPAAYALTLDVARVGPALSTAGGARWNGQMVGGGVIRVVIDPIDSPSSELEYHRIEAAFNIGHDPEKVLEHRLAIVALPDAQLSDRMALGKAYGDVGQHAQAVQTYRPLLPQLMADARAGGPIRTGRHLRQIAPSFIAMGDLDTARELLEAEGLTPTAEIPDLIKRLRVRPQVQRSPWFKR